MKYIAKTWAIKQRLQEFISQLYSFLSLFYTLKLTSVMEGIHFLYVCELCFWGSQHESGTEFLIGWREGPQTLQVFFSSQNLLFTFHFFPCLPHHSFCGQSGCHPNPQWHLLANQIWPDLLQSKQPRECVKLALTTTRFFQTQEGEKSLNDYG